MHEWLWQLWLEEHDVDVPGWARKHLAKNLKGLSKRSSKAYKFILDRIRNQIHRISLGHYADIAAAGRAGPAQQTSIHHADPPIFDLILKVAGLPGNTKLPSGELKNIEQRLSLPYLCQVLDTAMETKTEIEQARRDWRMFRSWVDALETVDWDVVAPDMELKIRSLTGARADPPSIQKRKAQRQRPLPPPPIVQAVLAFWDDPAARAAVLPFLIDLRRSPLLDFVISLGAVMLDAEISGLPRRLHPRPKNRARFDLSSSLTGPSQ
jgi:hypothetical protein